LGFFSAVERVLETYSEAAGHDAMWAGLTRFTYFRDRLDRVFSCRRHTISDNVDGDPGLDSEVFSLGWRGWACGWVWRVCAACWG